MSFIPGNAGSPAQAPDGIRGLTDGSTPAAGVVGELVSASLARVGTALTTTIVINVPSAIVLTPGDWDIRGCLGFTLTGATLTVIDAGISVTSGALPSNAFSAVPSTGGSFRVRDTKNLVTATGDITVPVPSYRVSTVANLTLYLVASATFSAGTVSAYGWYEARRVR